METRNRRSRLRLCVKEVSKGSSPMILVYRVHTRISTTKANPNSMRLEITSELSLGAVCVTRTMAPIESASPNTRSESASMRSWGNASEGAFFSMPIRGRGRPRSGA